MEVQKEVQFHKVGGEPKAAIPGVLLLQGIGLPLSPHSLTGECGLMEVGQRRQWMSEWGAGLSEYSAPRSPALIAHSHDLHSPPLLYSTDARKSFA